MKKITLIIILFFISKTYSQVKLFINKDEKKRYQNIYSLTKSSDSQYISFTNSEDMGVIYGCRYEFLKKIPDNEYQIYINDTLTSIHTYNKKTTQIIEYYPNGNLRAMQNDGLSNRTYKSYFENGEIMRDSPTKYFITDYYRNGNVKTRFFSVDNQMFIEEYESNGRIRETSFRYNRRFREDNFKRNYNLKNGVLDGKSTIVFDKLSFNLKYDMNKLLYILIKENGKIKFKKNYH